MQPAVTDVLAAVDSKKADSASAKEAPTSTTGVRFPDSPTPQDDDFDEDLLEWCSNVHVDYENYVSDWTATATTSSD
jgi:hypothetical protein